MRRQVLGMVALLMASVLLCGCNAGRDNGTGDATDMGKPNAGNAPPPDTTVK